MEAQLADVFEVDYNKEMMYVYHIGWIAALETWQAKTTGKIYVV